MTLAVASRRRAERRGGGEERSPSGDVDFDLHGLAGIRLVDASSEDAAAVSSQLGPIRRPLEREPDIVVRFVDELRVSSPLRFLGLDDAAFTDDAFLVLRTKHKARARVQIPFAEIGARPEIVCERGVPAVPLLVPILNLTVLARGALPLHASAFVHSGKGVVATGWSKGGKTEALLAFAARGARYVGDEWVYVSGDGERVVGIPEPVRLWEWHLRELPELRRRVRGGQRARLRALALAASVASRAGDGRGVPRARRAFSRALPLLERQRHVDVEPGRLFGDVAGPGAVTFDRLFLVVSHASHLVAVEPVDADAVARRMAFSLQHERSGFLEYYLKFRFAFPGAANPLIEQAEEIERGMLARVFSGKPAFAVYHPYPVAIPRLYDAMSPYVE